MTDPKHRAAVERARRMKAVVVCDQALPGAAALFTRFGEVRRYPGEQIDAAIVRDADILLVRSRTRVDAELLDASSVAFVGSAVAGRDHIDERYLRERGIACLCADGCNANAVAEYVIITLAHTAVRLQRPLAGQTLAIIGVGHVGRAVAAKARHLGMRCLLNDPPRAQREGATAFTELATCLRNADFISLHTPLTYSGEHATFHLLDQRNLTRINPETVLINAARGAVIDQNALLRSDLHHLVIDCWDHEPAIHPEMVRRALIATPHIAGASHEARLAGSVMLYQGLCRFLGEQEAAVPADLLADAALKTLPPPAGIPASLAELLAALGDTTAGITAVDRQMRSATNPESLAQQFVALRRSYDFRHEWRRYAIDGHRLSAGFHQPLQRLEFRIRSPG